MDAGTTTLEMIPFLSSISNVKVVTNSVKHAALLIDQGIETLILGGTIKISTNAVLGSGASEQLRKLRFNRCFIGMNGARVDAGFTTPDSEEAMIKKSRLKIVKKLMYYWTILNFNKLLFAQVAAIEDAEIITDFCPKNYAAKFRTQNDYYGGIRMIYTVTLNPSIDYIVHVEALQLGELNPMEARLLNFLAAKASMFLVFYSGSRSLPLHLDLLADSLDVSLKIG